MPKRILCYGDSITWGYNPKDGTRFPFAQTYPGVLQEQLGEDYTVITEALVGRTTCWDTPTAPYRNGKEFLPMLLESHSPLDLVILMLGVNDLSKLVGKDADSSAWGLLSLVRIILSPVFGGTPPKILIVAPPVPGKMDKLNEMSFGRKESEFAKLAECQKAIADVSLSEFLDANIIITNNGTDGVHPLPDQYEILGKAIAEKVKEMKI